MHVLTTLDEPRIRELVAADEFFWLDLLAPDDAQLQRAGELLRLHPVAIEDSQEFGQRPKLDLYDHHALLVFFAARATGDPVVPALPQEVHVFLSGGFVFTVRREPCSSLDTLHAQLAAEDWREEEMLVYRILDALTDTYFPVIELLQRQVDEVEAAVLERPRRHLLERVYRLKQCVHELQRIAADQRAGYAEMTHALLQLDGLAHGKRPYLRDVGDHLAQITAALQRELDDLIGLTATYFSANSDRLNAVVTRITVAGTLFICWTLVTGFFGQNFAWLTNRMQTLPAFLILDVGGLAVPTIVLLTLFYLKRDDWF